ncbi:MAG: acyl-CoA oxidase, partial [Alphaproteobacteria bacterium]|nr:acyl-CoA oxidase [Alphaproteobacteria bacterium]
FTDAIARVDDPALRRALLDLRDLHGLHTLEREQAWFLRHGVFEAPKARALRDEVHALCAEVRGAALAVVEGFAIPEVLIGSIDHQG